MEIGDQTEKTTLSLFSNCRHKSPRKHFIKKTARLHFIASCFILFKIYNLIMCQWINMYKSVNMKFSTN